MLRHYGTGLSIALMQTGLHWSHHTYSFGHMTDTNIMIGLGMTVLPEDFDMQFR